MQRDKDDPRRKFLIDALNLGLFAGLQTTGLLQNSHALGRVPPKLPEGRSIYKLDGDVRVDGSIANIDTPIVANSVIVTGANSQIIFVVGSDAFILRDNSRLEIEGSGFLIRSMRIISGKLLSVFGKRDKTHQITTSTATIGIRGTGLYVESDPELSYVCTCYGITRIVARDNPNLQEDIETKHHDRPLYILPGSGGEKLIIPAPIINHSDAELALIEELVGRKTPFGSSNGNYKSGDY